jgi:hypothetical protein
MVAVNFVDGYIFANAMLAWLHFCLRCLAVSPNFEIAKNNMAIALTDLGTKVIFLHFVLCFSLSFPCYIGFLIVRNIMFMC